MTVVNLVQIESACPLLMSGPSRAGQCAVNDHPCTGGAPKKWIIGLVSDHYSLDSFYPLIIPQQLANKRLFHSARGTHQSHPEGVHASPIMHVFRIDSTSQEACGLGTSGRKTSVAKPRPRLGLPIAIPVSRLSSQQQQLSHLALAYTDESSERLRGYDGAM